MDGWSLPPGFTSRGCRRLGSDSWNWSQWRKRRQHKAGELAACWAVRAAGTDLRWLRETSHTLPDCSNRSWDRWTTSSLYPLTKGNSGKKDPPSLHPGFLCCASESWEAANEWPHPVICEGLQPMAQVTMVKSGIACRVEWG